MVALSKAFPAPKESFHLISCPLILLSICSGTDVSHFKLFWETNIGKGEEITIVAHHKIVKTEKANESTTNLLSFSSCNSYMYLLVFVPIYFLLT